VAHDHLHRQANSIVMAATRCGGGLPNMRECFGGPR
jgi:hypothetical protein